METKTFCHGLPAETSQEAQGGALGTSHTKKFIHLNFPLLCHHVPAMVCVKYIYAT